LDVKAKWCALICITMLALCGCSTVQSRIQERRAVFDRLPPPQQRLVTRGEVREGMSRDAVYMAWGKPDEIWRGTRHGAPIEVWTYYIASQEVLPHYTYVPRLIRRHHVLDTIYDPQYVTHWYPYRSVNFENGRVAAWQQSADPLF
jgi:hypothetical protein